MSRNDILVSILCSLIHKMPHKQEKLMMQTYFCDKYYEMFRAVSSNYFNSVNSISFQETRILIKKFLNKELNIILYLQKKEKRILSY